MRSRPACLAVWMPLCAHPMRSQYLLSPTALLVLVAACASQPPPRAMAPVPSNFLWKANIAGKPGTIYVLGSLHLNTDNAQLDSAVTKALTDADQIYFEIDPDEPEDAALAVVLEHGMYEPGESLSDSLRPETVRQLRETLTEAGLSMDTFSKMRPWLVAVAVPVVVMQKKGFSPEFGVERLVERFARAEPTRARELHGLETMDEQLSLLMELGKLDPDVLVLETVRGMRGAVLSSLVSAYQAGDPDTLLRLLQAGRDESPEAAAIFRKFIDDRNVTMARGIMPSFEHEGSTVMVVGAAHVLGDNGVVKLLTTAGATVRPVPPGGPPSEAVAAYFEPRAETYQANEAGFEFKIKTKVMHTQQEVPIGPEATSQVEVYQSSLTANTSLIISVMGLSDTVTMTPEVVAQIAGKTLTRTGIPAQTTEPTRVAGQPASLASGSGPERSARCWVFGAPGRLFSVLSVTSKDPDPEGQLATDEAMQTFQLLPSKGE